MAHPVLDSQQVWQNLNSNKNPFWDQYYAFFSTWHGGIIKDPGALMLLPMDDHVVHRGDGVFEALKTRGRKIYLLEPHLDRLKASADKIGLPLPMSLKEIAQTIVQTLKVADQSETLVRVFLTRGPGGFTANPYDALASQLYVIVTKLSPPPFEKYINGIKIGKSLIPVKEGFMAQIKSCNYLPNVLMKKESVDRSLDFTVGFDAQGFLAESSTENIMIIDAEGALTHPQLDKILKGTTMTRCFELAKKAGLNTAVKPISEKDLLSAREVIMSGTTFDILPVVSYEAQPIGDGKVGSEAKKLLDLLEDDMKSGTPF